MTPLPSAPAILRAMRSRRDDPLLTLPKGIYYGDKRRRRRLDGLLLTETAYRPGERLPAHQHARAYACLVVGGGFEEREGGRTRECGPATVIFHPAGSSHADRFGDRPSRCFNVEMDEGWLDRMTDGVGAPPNAPRVFRARRANWIARHLFDEFRSEAPAGDLAIEGLSLALLAEVLRAPDGRAEPAPAWLDRAVEILWAAFPDDPGLSAIADEVCVHPVHLARVFRRHHGCSLGEYARRLRLERATEALVNTDLPIGRIAHRTGFADHSHLSRAFRRQTGLTPSAYRARHQRRSAGSDRASDDQDAGSTAH